MGQIGVLGFNTITIVLLARYWGEYLFGIFSYALVFVGFFTLIPDFGMKPILIREISRNQTRAKAIMSNALFLKLGLSFLSIILACVSAFVISKNHQIQVAIIILAFIMLLSSKTGAVRIAFESLFHAEMEMQFPVLFQLLDSVLQTATVAVLILSHAGFMEILAGYVLANLLGLILTIVFIKKRVHFTDSPNIQEMMWLLKEAFPLFVYLILAMLYERLDVLFLKSLWGESYVGLYSSAFRLTAPLIFIPFAITTSLYPLMSRTYSDSENMLPKLFGLGLKTLLVIGISIGSAGILIGNPVFLFLFGRQFMEAVVPFQLLLWSQSVMFLIFFLVDYNNARDRQSKNTLYIAMMILLSLYLQRFFILRYGVLGAGWVKIILNFTGLTVLFAISRRSLGKEQSQHFYKTALVLLLFLIVACSSLILDIHDGIKWVIFGAAILFCVLWLFSQEEKSLLKKTIQGYFSNPIQ